MDEPLTFTEVRAMGRRRFELFHDRVVLHIKSFNETAEATFDLSHLRSRPNYHRLWEWPFGVGVIMFFLPLTFFGLPWIFGRKVFFFEQLVPIMIIGAVLCLYYRRKVALAVFVTQVGVPVLAIADVGPDRDQYREFIEQLITRIEASQSYH